MTKVQNIISANIKPESENIDINEIDESIINHFLTNKRESGRIDKSGGLSNSYAKTMSIIINSAINYAVEKDFR